MDQLNVYQTGFWTRGLPAFPIGGTTREKKPDNSRRNVSADCYSKTLSVDQGPQQQVIMSPLNNIHTTMPSVLETTYQL